MNGFRHDSPTSRELQILAVVALSETVVAAAAKLGLSPHTVDAVVDSLRRKLGLRTIKEIVAWAYRAGLLQAESESRHASTPNSA